MQRLFHPERAEQPLLEAATSTSRPTAVVRVADLAADSHLMDSCMNTIGDITECVVPSRQGVLKFSTT